MCARVYFRIIQMQCVLFSVHTAHKHPKGRKEVFGKKPNGKMAACCKHRRRDGHELPEGDCESVLLQSLDRPAERRVQ